MVNLNFPNSGGVFRRRYKILGVLGVGENSTVYQARDLQFPDARRLGRPVIVANEISAWESERNAGWATIDWRFTIPNARDKLKKLYPVREEL